MPSAVSFPSSPSCVSRAAAWRRDPLRLLAGLGLWSVVAATAACGGGQSTFDVSVNIDNTLSFEDLSMVTSCQVVVSGAAKDEFFIGSESKFPCNNGIQGKTLGTFGYTSSATSGTVKFEVNLIGNDPLAPPLGAGSGEGAAREGSRTPVSITVSKK